MDDVECAAWYLRMVHEGAPALTRRMDSLETLDAFDSEALTAALHRGALNVRHLGLVASCAELPHARDAAVVEMIARVAKEELRSAQRAIVWGWVADAKAKAKARAAGARSGSRSAASAAASAAAWNELAAQQRVHAATLFDLVLGASSDCDAFWTSVLAPKVYTKFGYDIVRASYGDPAGWTATDSAVLTARRAVHRPALLFALSHQCGFELTFAADAGALDALAPRLGVVAQPIALDALRVVAGGVACKASFELGGEAGSGDVGSECGNSGGSWPQQ